MAIRDRTGTQYLHPGSNVRIVHPRSKYLDRVGRVFHIENRRVWVRLLGTEITVVLHHRSLEVR